MATQLVIRFTLNEPIINSPCTRISLLQNPNSSWSHGLCQTPSCTMATQLVIRFTLNEPIIICYHALDHSHPISNKVYLKWTYNHMLPCTRIPVTKSQLKLESLFYVKLHLLWILCSLLIPVLDYKDLLCQTPFAMNIMFSFNSSSWLKRYVKTPFAMNIMFSFNSSSWLKRFSHSIC